MNYVFQCIRQFLVVKEIKNLKLEHVRGKSVKMLVLCGRVLLDQSDYIRFKNQMVCLFTNILWDFFSLADVRMKKKKNQGYASIWMQFVQMYNWAEAISNPVINSEPPAFSYFKVCFPPFKDRNQIRIALKDITLRVLSRKNITGKSLDIRLYQVCLNLNSWTLIFKFNINRLVFKFP